MIKIINSALLLVMVVSIVSSCKTTEIAAQNSPADNITYQTFYDDLSPYGVWIDYPTYGHVWHPRLDEDFRPYATNGNWEYSTDGWAWQSNYNWGWAPFHYGSWLYDDMYGWLWVPGYDWSPAWVTWGDVDDYYCWAPIMAGVSIDLQFGSWRPNSFYWNVCSRAHIYDRNLGNVIVGRDRINAIAGRISIINNYHTNGGHNYYSKGPDLRDVERYTNRKINPVRFRDMKRPGMGKHDGSVMRIYRPEVQHPQPHEFRRPDAGHTNPIHEEGQHPRTGRTEQHDNVESLPTHRSDRPGFGRGVRGDFNRGGGAGRSRRGGRDH